MSDPNRPLSFEEFEPPTYGDWYAAAVEALKGASFEKTLTTPSYEGLVLQPLYRREDTEHSVQPRTLPGKAPFLRGSHASGYLHSPWTIAQAIRCPTAESLNTALRTDLEGGLEAVNFVLDAPTRQGLDPDQAAAEDVGRDGVSIASAGDFATIFAGLDLTALPLFLPAGAAALPLTALLFASLHDHYQPLSDLRGCIENDPLGFLAENGQLPVPVAQAYDEMAALTIGVMDHAPRLGSIAIHSSPYADAGANAVQELAYALATGVAYIRALQERGQEISSLAAHMHFFFSVGANFFMETAKLRVARVLWSQVVDVFGGDIQAQKMNLHVRSTSLNKSSLDPYTNLLRTTLEALAGVIGGTDSLAITAFDETVGQPDEFSRRLARNQHLILRHEVGLTSPIDPAGGAWYIEYLTDWLGRQAWAQFQEIESQGGMLAALQTGMVQSQVAGLAEQRISNVQRRKDVLVGVNMYPDLQEKPLIADLFQDEIRQKRGRADGDSMAALQQLSSAAQDQLFDTALAAAQAGATLGQITQAMRVAAGEGPRITRLPAQRLAEDFEDLRRAAMAYGTRTGHAPQIFLANLGQYRARADFTAAFFEVGGFDVLDNPAFDTPQAAAEAASQSGAPVVAICSTDDQYPQIVPPLVQAIKNIQPETYVILAGFPEAQVEAYRAAGIDDFIHMRSNCYAINLKVQQQIGVHS